ncbi:MAG: hypothetical protein KDA78_05545, partial [Planctomycetaceae bacterium]|nr:hypothetical protein [Planctomycetaceae bacterium]
MSIAESTDQPRWSRQTQEAARIPGTEWQFETEPRAESGFDIRSIIWERKWLLIFFGAIGAALGYLEYTKEPPVYRSSASVLVDRYQPRIPIEGIDPLAGQKDPLSTHLALFNTPVILSKAIEDFRLGELSSLSSGNPMKSISDGLTVTRSAKSDDILQFTFTCGHAEDARQVLEAVIASYFDFLGETQRDASSKTLELINEAGEELAKSLSEKEQTYQKFREQSALLWTSDEGQNIHQTRLAQIEAERSGLLISSSQIRAELDAFRGALERGTSRQALLMMADQSRQRSGEEEKEGSQSSTTIASQLIPLMLEESMLLERLGSQHPKVVEIRKRIEVTRELLSREAGEQIGVAPGKPQPDLLTLYMQSLEEELKSNQEKLRELDDLFLTERDSSSKLSLDENQGRVLREELQRTKKLYDVVLEKLQEVSLVDENSTLTATIINHPSDGAQLHLKVFNYAGLGGAGGLAFGMLIGLLLEYSDKRFRSPEEMMSALNAPILGHIPEMPQLPKRRREKTLKETGVDPSIVSFHRPNSRIAEAYRLVRSSVLMGIKGDRARIIQFTSPDP